MLRKGKGSFQIWRAALVSLSPDVKRQLIESLQTSTHLTYEVATGRVVSRPNSALNKGGYGYIWPSDVLRTYQSALSVDKLR